MRLSKYSDYTLRVLMYLAIHEGEMCQIGKMSEDFKVSKNNMMKIVNDLSKRGVVQTHRGNSGGITLNVSPNELMIGKIVRQSERTTDPIDCAGMECPIEMGCKLKVALATAMESFFSTLDKYSLADVISNQAYLKSILGQSHSS